jgi:hypothetical protein
MAPGERKMVGPLIFLVIGDAAGAEKWTKMVHKWCENGFVRLFAEAVRIFVVSPGVRSRGWRTSGNAGTSSPTVDTQLVDGSKFSAKSSRIEPLFHMR